MVPLPLPSATAVPAPSLTSTVHGRAAESRAVKRIGPPTRALGLRVQSFGRPMPRHPARDRPELAVERVPRTAREARVAVARDRRRRTGVPAGYVELPPETAAVTAARVDVADVEPPGQQVLERRPRCRRERRRVVDAEDRDAHTAGVEATGVRADHVLRDAAAAALEDSAELVDEEVVADVVPAVREHVVALDAAHDRGRLGRRVAVRARGVVDDGEAEAAA